MGRHLVEDVRDIALVGLRAAGKTSLADALLFEAHAVDRLGSVDDGTSVADADEDEQRHHYSIDAHVFQYFWPFLPEASEAVEAAGRFARELTPARPARSA